MLGGAGLVHRVNRFQRVHAMQGRAGGWSLTNPFVAGWVRQQRHALQHVIDNLAVAIQKDRCQLLIPIDSLTLDVHKRLKRERPARPIRGRGVKLVGRGPNEHPALAKQGIRFIVGGRLDEKGIKRWRDHPIARTRIARDSRGQRVNRISNRRGINNGHAGQAQLPAQAIIKAHYLHPPKHGIHLLIGQPIN